MLIASLVFIVLAAILASICISASKNKNLIVISATLSIILGISGVIMYVIAVFT